MKNKNYGDINIRPHLLAVLLCMVLLALSCDEFVEVERPNSQITSGEVFLEMGTATAAMTDVYSKMRDSGILAGNTGGQSFLLGLYADELDYYGSISGNTPPFYANAVPSSNGAVLTLWNSAYNQIFAANSVLEGLRSSIALPEAGRGQLMGEALFARAFVHSNLAGIFGPVPYISGTDPVANSNAPKISAHDVFGRAKADLEQAIGLLPEEYATPNRVRPNRYAAYALLARICLYRGEWHESVNAASAVINNTALYPYNDNLSTLFLRGSTSTIWQFSPKSPTGNTIEGTTFIFSSGPPPSVALSASLMASFSAGDQRKAMWTKTISNANGTWHHAFKYKKNSTSTPSAEYPILLRLGELYLIRAEARAQEGFLTGAKEDLNKIRHTAGLGVTPATTQPALLEAILAERRTELFTEQGHRFHDLKRSGNLDAVLETVKPGWNSTDRLLPIPVTELNLSPNLLPQNLGY